MRWPACRNDMPVMKNRRNITFRAVVLIQLSVMLYTLSGVAGKYASAHAFLSMPFILLYGLEICILGIYAIVWQQIIKRYDLSIAYANEKIAKIMEGMEVVKAIVVRKGDEIKLVNLILKPKK